MTEIANMIKTLRGKLNGVPTSPATLPRALPLELDQILYDEQNKRCYVKADDVLDAISAALRLPKE